MTTISAIHLVRFFIHSLCRCHRNALDMPYILWAHHRCVVTTLDMPQARHECSMTTQSITNQNSVGMRRHAVDALQKHHGRCGSAMISPCCGKCEIICFIFLYFRAIPRYSEKSEIDMPMLWDRGSA